MRPLGGFWERVDKSGSCWLWLGGIQDGYGSWYVGNGRAVRAHRVAYEELVGPIPGGLVIDHLCRNRRCVNPAHMEVVTVGENVMRGETLSAQYAARDRCNKGHPFTPDNLKKARGRGRECRQCDLERKRRLAWQRKKAS